MFLFKGKVDYVVLEFSKKLIKIDTNINMRDLICVGQSVKSVSLRSVMCLAPKIVIKSYSFHE